jgi:predicted phosphohydrolase
MVLHPNHIQVCSDLHLEFGDILETDFADILVPVADVLVLAGDIGNPYSLLFDAFLSYCSSHFTHVLFVSGNHEYYGSTLEKTDKLIRGLFSKYDNLHYLNNSVFAYGDVVFVGTTLWSHIPSDIDSYDSYDLFSIKDFSSSVSNSLFFRNLDFIHHQLALALAYGKKCIVITHHAPSLQCISDQYHEDPTRCFFYTPLDDFFSNPNLIGWIYGHTHYNWRHFDVSSGCFVYANCYRSKDYLSSSSFLLSDTK